MKILAIIALSLLSSCVSANYIRFSRAEPVADRDLQTLVPGESDLGDCLARLGAPHLVWKAAEDSMAIAYAWLNQGDWSVGLSYSLEQFGLSAEEVRKQFETYMTYYGIKEGI